MAAPNTRRVLSLISSGVSLVEAHSQARALKGDKPATVAECVSAAPAAWGVDPADTAALAGTRGTVRFTKATAAQVAEIQRILDSGEMRRPWLCFPWWPQPDAPF